MATKVEYGRETSDADIRARQKRDLDKANKMFTEDLDPARAKKYSAEQMKDRLSFMTEALANSNSQKQYDAEVADKPKREAANEMRRETRGVEPTPSKDRAGQANLSVARGWREQNPTVAKMLGTDGMKKGGKVKKYATGGAIPAAPVKDNRRPKGDTGIADIWTVGKGKPPMDDDSGSIPKGTVKKAKGGSIRSASSRGDGCAVRGKTRA